MRFRRRPDQAPPEEQTPPPVEAPTDAAPPGRVVVAFAGVLDGRRLWVAVESRPGSIRLRRTASDDVLALSDDAVDDQPAYLSARLDLAGLPPEPATYDVVHVPAGGGAPRALWTPPLAAHRPPQTPDGRARHTLERADDGTLRLRREILPAAVELLAVSAGSGEITLGIAGTGTALRLLDDDGAPLASWPAEPDDSDRPGGVVVRITAAPAAGVAPRMGLLALDDVVVRRRADDLADPGNDALLPLLNDAATDQPLLRLRWSSAGLLQMRVRGSGDATSEEQE